MCRKRTSPCGGIGHSFETDSRNMAEKSPPAVAEGPKASERQYFRSRDTALQ